jgi:hypothetical protein
MIKRYTTKSGSIYTIDFEKKTWHRLRGERAMHLRTDDGTFISFADTEYIYMICLPINPIYDSRVIISTNIVKVEELQDAQL